MDTGMKARKLRKLILQIVAGMVFVLVLTWPMRTEPGWSVCWHEEHSYWNDCGMVFIAVRGDCPKGWNLDYHTEQSWNIFGWAMEPMQCS